MHEIQWIDVLLVEDSPTDALLAQGSLGESPLFRVTHVQRLDRALEILSQRKMSAVLLDLGLPDSQGLDTLNAVRRHSPGVPVIVLTSRNDDDLAVHSAQGGAQEYLVKGQFQEGNLCRAVRYVIERDRSERALRESELHLRAIINTTPQCITVIAPNGKVLEMNAAGFRLVEADSPEEVIGRSVFPLIAPQDRVRYLAFHEAVCQGHEGTLEYDLIGLKGSRRTVAAAAAPLASGDGRMLHLAIGEDVTERKKVQAELWRTGDLLRAVIDGTSDAVFVKDLQGRYRLCNAAAAAFVGRTAEKVLESDDRALFDPDDARKVMAHDRRIMESGKGETAEEVLTARGVTCTFLVTKSPHRDGQGKVIGLLGISRDISERKRLEAERDRAAQRLRLQVERMPLACLLFDARLLIVDWNPAAEHIFGYSKEEVLGMEPPYWKILSPGTWSNAQEILDRLKGGDMAAHSVSENLTRGGRTITCEWHNTPLFDDIGRFQGLVSLAEDVTSRHEAEKTIKLRDRAIQAVSQGIVITDANQPDNPIIYASPSFEQLTGYTPAATLGKNCRFLQGADTDPNSVAQIRAAVRNGEFCTVELLNYRRDGTPYWNELRLSPIRDESGQLCHFVGTLADVTARRELEDHLRQSQKIEAVGQLAGGIAHDFNNLLTIIIGYSDVLQSTESLTESGQNTIDEIALAAHRAAALTQQLLAFSRKQVLEPAVLNLNELIGNLQKMLLRLVTENIELTCSLSPAIRPVKVDPGQIEQVIVNLVVNARDAMPDGGRLTIGTSNVELSSADCRLHPDRKPGCYVRLVVADTGAGIPPEIKFRVFEPFFTTKETGKGTGLGLSVVHGIVKQSGGYIDVHSEVGVGTAVILFFPAVREQMPAAAAERETGSGKARIGDDLVGRGRGGRKTLGKTNLRETRVFGHRGRQRSKGTRGGRET